MHEPRQLERLLTTLGRFTQRDGHLVLQILARLDARPALAPAAAEATEAAAEEIGELRQDVLDAGEALEAGRARPGVPILIVELALLRIGEHLIGLGELLEARLRRVVARVVVGMAFHRQLAVSLLDFRAVTTALEA